MRVWIAAWLALAAFAAPPSGDSIYPGARIDALSTQQARAIAASQPGLDLTVCTTADPFEKVFVFFQKQGRQFQTIGSRVRKLPNGQELREAFFILDDARDTVSSKRWVKVQRPYIGQYGLARNSAGQYDIRDVTAITLAVKK